MGKWMRFSVAGVVQLIAQYNSGVVRTPSLYLYLSWPTPYTYIQVTFYYVLWNASDPSQKQTLLPSRMSRRVPFGRILLVANLSEPFNTAGSEFCNIRPFDKDFSVFYLFRGHSLNMTLTWIYRIRPGL